MQAVTVRIGRETRQLAPGAVRGQVIINLAGISSGEQVLLERSGDIDVPLAANDVIFIRGGEKFSIGDGAPAVEDNPLLRKPVPIKLNDQVVSAQHLPRAKATGAELKRLAGGGNVDLWSDLDGLADELVGESDRVVLQEVDQFFTAPASQEDRFYEVTVILDGLDRPQRFPAEMTVRQAIRRSLPPRDRPQVDQFDMVDGNLGQQALNPDATLKAAGVRDGHVLSITKKNGGGG